MTSKLLSNKKFIIAICSALVAVIVLGIVLAISINNNEKNIAVNNDDSFAYDGEGNGLNGEGGAIPMPTEMTFSRVPMLSNGETGITVTASVKPDTATDKSVDWSVAWNNPDGSFASGKTVTDYVTVTPTSDGSTTATVNCLEAFGDQIVVTVTSRSNTNACAMMTVDFAKKISDVNITFASGSYSLSNNVLSFKTSSAESATDPYSSTIVPNVDYTYGVGTIDSSVNEVNYYIKASDELQSYYSSAVVDYVELSSFNQYTLLDSVFNAKMYTYHDATPPISGPDGLVVPSKPAGYTFASTTWNNICNAINQVDGTVFNLKVEVVTDYGTSSIILDVTVNSSTTGAVAESISLNKSNYIF